MFKLKSPITYEQQLALLESRGMSIPDREEALTVLQNENYYRLSGYTFHMKKSAASEAFKEGSSFDTVMYLYNYDKALRHMLFKYIDTIEIRFRTKISYCFSHACSSYGHYNPINFISFEACDDFCDSLTKAIEKNKDAAFVRQHISKYSDLSSNPPVYNMPLWVAVEIISFSTLSKFYRGIGLDAVKKEIAFSVNINAARLDNWLHAIACLRNLCAHHGRIYNQELHPSISYSPIFYASLKPLRLKTDHIFGYIPALIALLPDYSQRHCFVHDLKKLNESYFSSIDKSLLGYPDDWDQYLNKWESIETSL